jgi:subtilisin family serine protease
LGIVSGSGQRQPTIEVNQGKGRKKTMNPNEEHQEHTYVLEPNTLIFQVRDLADQPQDFKVRLLNAFTAFLRPEGSGSPQIESYEESIDRPWRRMVNVPTLDDLRVIEFPPLMQVQGSQRFSLIPLRLERDKSDLEPEDVLKVLNDAYIELEGRFTNSGGKGGRSKFQPITLNNDIDLISISPNWLGGGLPHTKPTGGPGSLPASTPAPVGMPRRFELRGSAALDSLSRFRRPGAQMIIFDTARDLKEFPSPVRDIFTADPPMEVYPYPQELISVDFDALPPYWIPDNEHYDMSDHGTFIASIIRSITPSTKIYLYQVLNAYGMGSFVTVAHGLKEALNRHAQGDTQLVFNCSLGMTHKLPEKNKSKQPLQKLFPKLWEQLIQELIFMALRDAFAQVISHPNITVVAAAGNEAQEGDAENGTRPFAWYPAAFDKVLSVAALPKPYPRDKMRGRKFKPATYSNSAQSEDPGKDKAYSFATFGGDRKNGPPGSPDRFSPVGGVLGVYIGVIPTENPDESLSQNGPPNPTCFALWSGTSFATPIISALVAAQQNELIYSSTRNLRPYLSTVDENVIRMRQV